MLKASMKEDRSHGRITNKNSRQSCIRKKKIMALGLDGMRVEIKYSRTITRMKN